MSLDTAPMSADREPDTAASRPSRRPGRWTALVGVAAVVVALLALGIVRLGTTDGNQAVESSREISAADLERQFGVRLDVVGLLAGGGLVELRFRVTDAELAVGLLGHHDDMPVLAVEGSDRVLEAAKGMKHQLVLLDGASYFLLYTNVANALHEGSLVSLVVNGVRVPHLEVLR